MHRAFIHPSRRSNSGSLAILAAMRRASRGDGQGDLDQSNRLAARLVTFSMEWKPISTAPFDPRFSWPFSIGAAVRMLWYFRADAF